MLIYTHTHKHQETLFAIRIQYTHTSTRSIHIYSCNFDLMDTLRVRAYLYTNVCECMFQLGSVFSSWSLDFRIQYFQQRGELCIKLYTISIIYLFSSNRSVTPFISLSLLSPQSRSVPCFLHVCVCVFFVLVKTHSFICSLSLLFQILLCVNPLYIFWTKHVCVALRVYLFCVVLFFPLKHQSNLLHENRERFAKHTYSSNNIHLKWIEREKTRTQLSTYTYTHTNVHTDTQSRARKK